MQKRILLCDDECELLRPTEYALNRAGMDVHCAESAQQAWELLKIISPDVLVTDWHMPNLDGVALIRRVRSDPSLQPLPIILMTADFESLTDSSDYVDLDLAAVLAKPFSPRELQKRIEQVIETSGMIRPTRRA